MNTYALGALMLLVAGATLGAGCLQPQADGGTNTSDRVVVGAMPL